MRTSWLRGFVLFVTVPVLGLACVGAEDTPTEEEATAEHADAIGKACGSIDDCPSNGKFVCFEGTCRQSSKACGQDFCSKDEFCCFPTFVGQEPRCVADGVITICGEAP